MKAVAVSLLIGLSVNVYGDVKWIPIEPIKINESSKQDINKSKLPPANKWIENVKVLQRLLDKSKDDLTTENKKNWYSLDNAEND